MPAIVHKKQVLGHATDTEVLVKDTVGWVCKNFLQNTATTETKNGITFTVNQDKTISLSGTATESTEFIIGEPVGLSVGETYVLTGCPKSGSLSTYAIRRREYDKPLEDGDIGNGYKFVQTVTAYVYVIYVRSGITVNGLEFKPMIRRNAIVNANYEPYNISVEERLKLIESSTKGMYIMYTMSADNWEDNVYSFESIYPSDRFNLVIEPNGDIINKSQFLAWGKAGIVGKLSENSCIAMNVVPKEDIPIILEISEINY